MFESFSPSDAAFTKKAEALKKKFPYFLRKLKKSAFTKLPWVDFQILKKIRFHQKIREVILIGMGGSSLGTRLLNRFSGSRIMTFLDNIEPSFVSAKLYSLPHSGYIFSSKSGETIEVLSLAKILMGKKARSGNSFVITDEPKSTLVKLAKKNRIPVVLGRKNVPGRFSVLSETALLPWLLSGPVDGYGDIERLLAGAKKISWQSAYLLAVHQYLHAKNGKNISVLFSYCDHLKIFSEWYTQLLSESIGKSAKVGITPVAATGVTDQHSALQLFLDGPKDKFFLFFKNDSTYGDRKIPGKKYSLAALFNAEYEGVKGAFTRKKLPYFEIRFQEITPEVLGKLIFFFELEVAFLGLLYGINFENQPAVEMSKQMAKKILNDK